jgi:hypothetical protein
MLTTLASPGRFDRVARTRSRFNTWSAVPVTLRTRSEASLTFRSQ